MFTILLSCVIWIGFGGVMGLLTDVTTTGPTPAPFTMCEYKQAYYSLGQQWTDGACSHCYCMSTAGNVSICRTSCPTYTFVPNQCNLTAVEGKCCPEVKCDFDNKCIYKGNYYAQGVSWNDGCKAICTCVSSVTKLVQCQARCPIMNLPSGCQLVQPEKGSTVCCPTIHCGGTVIG